MINLAKKCLCDLWESEWRLTIDEKRAPLTSIVYQIDAFSCHIQLTLFALLHSVCACVIEIVCWFAFELYTWFRVSAESQFTKILNWPVKLTMLCVESTKAWNQKMKINNSFNAPHLIMLLGLQLIYEIDTIFHVAMHRCRRCDGHLLFLRDFSWFRIKKIAWPK